jgi:hypothetical protein
MHAHAQDLRLWYRRLGLRRDIIVSAILVAIATWLVFWKLSHLERPEAYSGITAAWIGLVLAYCGGVVRISATRVSLVTLFTSEIRAIQFGLVRMKMFHFYELVYSNPEPAGFDELPREENYFALFHGVIGNVVNLHPGVVEAVVRYYTYLKMSRDAAGAFKTWKAVDDREVRKEHVRYVVQLLSLSSLWGFVALWHMGRVPVVPDWQLAASMKHAVDLLCGEGEFAKLVRDHPQHAALVQFFGSAPQQSSGEFEDRKSLIELNTSLNRSSRLAP